MSAKLKRRTLTDYIKLCTENEQLSIFNAFKSTFPLRNMDEAIHSHYGASYHSTGYSYYKFANELSGDMFVTMQRSDTWEDNKSYSFSYTDSNNVYNNSDLALENLLEDSSMHNPIEIQRYILKRDKLKALYKQRYNLELEISELKRNRMAVIDKEINEVKNL
jgi:hypothetical protein